MNVSLTPELEKFVEEKVASGRYTSASEVIRESLRTYEAEERWREYARKKIAEGMEDVKAGRLVDGETAMKQIRARIREKQQKK